MSGIDFTDHDESSSLFDPNYTYSNDKYSCIRGFYFAHIIFNYFVFLSGAGCLITRVLPKYKWVHSWLGRVYILSMLWSTTTSTLMNNTGLPLSTIISFGAVMGGLTVGWIAIVLHKQQIDRASTALVQEHLVESSTTKDGDMNLGKMLQDAKEDVADAKTFKQRFFSFKALHGVVFFVSWMQICGRIFASNQSGDFTCHTYPVWKPIDTPEGDYAEKNLTLVPVNDPDYDSLPWANGVVAWSLQIILGSMFGAMFVGAVWCYLAVRKERKNEADEADEANEADESHRNTQMFTSNMPNNISDPSSHSDGDDDGFVDEGGNLSAVGVESAVSVKVQQ